MAENKRKWAVISVPADLQITERLHKLAEVLALDPETGRPLPLYVILHRALTHYENEVANYDKSDTAKVR